MRGSRYERTAPGFYRRRPDDMSAVSTTQRILDARASMPAGALIAGWAAAYVHGVDTLDGLDDFTMAPLPVPVLLPPGLHRQDTQGVHYVQSKHPARRQVVEEVPVTALMRTAVDLARHAPNVTEATVALDAFLGARLLTPERLQRSMHLVDGTRGVRQARQAVDLARVGVRSPWETRLRVFAELELGLVALEPNRAVFDRSGNLLGVPDLLDAEAGLALEYDGATWKSVRAQGHRDRTQHREDNAREERLERAGLIVVGAEKIDLTRYRVGLAERITAARADGLSRNRERDRWTLDEPDDWFGLPA